NPCVALNPGEDEAGRIYGCLAGCSGDGDCRFGYSCQSFEGQQVCLEKDQARDARNPDGFDDGEPCVANLNCKGGTCIREAENGTGEVSFPDGYCTTRHCGDDDDCHGGACINRERYTSCMETCESASDCRDGYECREGIEGRKFCDSKVEHIAPDTTGEQAFDIQCVNARSFTFDVPAGAIGFYLAPFTRGGLPLKPTTLTRPDGTALNIERDYGFHAINPQILQSLAPILFPATDAPGLRNSFGPGRYTMQVQTDSNEVCYYMIPKMSAGTKLDVNLYFVGVPGVTAATAAQNRDVQAFTRVMKEIYQTMGVAVNVARYIEADRQVSDMYSIVRDFNDIFGLVATSEAPGTTPEENLSVNVFLIDDFNIAEAQGLLGVSAGLPGMAGVHGNSGSGLIFSTANLGADNATLGQVMAHEIGHFLGLRHTTEHMGSAHDPISDTPTCLFPNLGYFCPDAKNFMFAFSLGNDQRQTTAGQAFVVRRSPLVQ
ncbi:MAG: M12 family metallo-peptidase, partial [Bradymonadaceae bacterium]